MSGTAYRTPDLDTDVIMVGAGPVGLFLAHELRRHAVRALVVEQLPAPTCQSRASTLDSRTMELFAERDLLDPLGPPSRGPGGHFAGLLLDLAAAADHPFAGQWKAPQTVVERVLAERVVALGGVVSRGTRVDAVTRHADHVEIQVVDGGRTRTLRCAYLVGCDGERSTVRRLAGFDFPGRPATKELIRADVAGIDIPNRRFERLPRGLAIASRGPDGVTRVMMHEYGRAPGTTEPAFDDVVAIWQRLTGEHIGHGRPLWINAFHDACRQATSYRNGRVLLAGDAAHVQLPVGGQAINIGLQDAADLGWKLAAQFGPRPDDGLLDSYHEIRHAAGRRALTFITAQAELLLGGPGVDGLRGVVAELLDIEPVRRDLATVLSGLEQPTPTHRTDRRQTMERLTGRTALVTGASRGIGRATALRLAREGALVCVHYGHDDVAAKDVVEAIEKDGGSAFAVRAELGVPGDVDQLFAALEAGLTERTGSTDLHILVNNAGVMGGVAPEEMDAERFDRLYAVNARAPFFLTQRAVRTMPDGGRIVNISSGLTRFANPQEIAYAMTKGAIDQLTLHYAKHLGARGITVNSVGPGITNNGGPVFDIPEAVEQMSALSVFGRVGAGEDIAAVVAFLAGDDGKWITGSYLDASGGTLLGGQPGR